MPDYTPMLEQYLNIKKDYADTILFFRLGDFYEMFFEDAQVASRDMEITLTARDGGQNRKVPMCGVPYHAAEGYIARLIAKGHKVAICEQVEDPKTAKGIVRREVTRIITPGTILDGNILPEKQNNYLAAVVKEAPYTCGLALADLSTGYFAVTEFSGPNAVAGLSDELARVQPAEILLADDDGIQDSSLWPGLSENTKISYFPDNNFSYLKAQQALLGHFQTSSLDGFGCREMPSGTNVAVRAAGGLLSYLRETQKTDLGHIQRLVTYSTREYMVLDWATRRNLELSRTLREGSRQGTLLWVLDKTATAMGGRMLKSWLEQPLLDPAQINDRLDATAELVDNIFLKSDLQQELSEVYDLERLLGRVALGTANARDMVALKKSLAVLPRLKTLLNTGTSKRLQDLCNRLDVLDDIWSLLERSIDDSPPYSVREGGLIKKGYHPEVDKLRSATTEGKTWLARMEAEERERTGIRSLKIGYNKVFGYYIEVTKSNLDAVPEDYIRKQTLVNGERFITPALKEYEAMILGAEEKLTQLEYELFNEVRREVAASGSRIQKSASVLAEVDVYCSLAETALKENYVRPAVNDGSVITINEGRHPVVEKVLRNEWFVPNDTFLDNEDNRLLLITGPNMAGKSTFLRQVALIVLMAQAGSFVPAREAEIGVVDRIFTRVGASDDLAMGQSTFMVEMNEVANILNHATAKSLLLLDEVGRGTSTFDGLSIAWAVAEYIQNPERVGAKTLFATHYHELTELSDMFPGIRNYCVAVKEKGDNIIFLRKIIPGGADRSYGIQVARLAGLPGEVLSRAQEVLQSLAAQENVGKTQREIAVSGKPPYEPFPLSQLSFFAEGGLEHPVIKELKSLNLNNMTPLEALNRLYDLKKKAEGEEE